MVTTWRRVDLSAEAGGKDRKDMSIRRMNLFLYSAHVV